MIVNKFHKVLPLLVVLVTLVVLPFVGGCGKVSPVPLSPLYNPTVYNSFDDGTTDNWVYDYSNPVTLASPPALSVENTTVFQGTYSLQIPVPSQGVSAGVTYSLSSYSVHTTFTGSVTVENFTGKILSMWVYWQSGLVNSPSQVGAQLFIKDTSYNYANGTFVTLVPNRWIQVTYATDSPAYQTTTPPDLTKVYEAGLQIAGAGSAVFTSSGVVYADNFGF